MLVKNLAATLCVAAAIGFTLVSDAHAGWGSSGGSWGSSGGSSGGSWGSRGSWGSSGGSSGGSWGSHGSSGGSWGSRGSSGGSSGLFSRLHARFHCHPRVVYASSGGSSGHYGGSSGHYYSGGSSGHYYSGGSSGGVVYSGGSNGTYYGGSSGTTVIDAQYAPIIVKPAETAPSAPPAPPMKDPEEGAVEGTEDPTSLNDGLLTIDLPSDAKIFVNGVETKTPGSHREYVSRGLDSNVDYAYDVKAVVVRNGQTLEESRKVTVRAGKTTRLNFDFAVEAVASEKVETKLTVKVPEGAKVYLAGNATNATGETRVYRTKALKAGEEWNNYIVRVSHTVNGQTISKEQPISLKAGDDRELSFDFNDASLADAR